MSLINQVVHNMMRPDVLAQRAYAVPDATGLVKLDAMENPYALPESLKVELGSHLAQVALHRYPVPTYRALKHKICRCFGVPAGFDVLPGNGSDELISMLSMACAKPGATVMAPVPTFVMYAISAQLAGLQFIGVPLRADLSLDLPALLAAMTQHQPALVFLANPNNPTGSWFAEDEVLQVVRTAAAYAGLVVVDEAYQTFAPGSIMARLPEFPNLIVMRTVSKIGLAGLRLGYMAAGDEILTEIDKVRPPYNINVLTAAAAEFLLDHRPIFDAQAAQICAQRDELTTTLRTLKQVQVFPSQANFLLIRVPDSDQVFRQLRERRILVKNVGTMHPLLNHCLRVTVSTPQENQLFVAALQEILK